MSPQQNEKINVLFVIMQMAMGGSERLVHNIILNLDRSRYNPYLAWFYGASVLQEFADLDVPLFHIPKVRRFDWSTMRRISEIIRDRRIHVVNAHHFMSMVYAFYGCKIRNSAKLIYTEHSQWEIENVSWPWKQVGRRLLARVENVVGVTDQVSDSLSSFFRVPHQKCFTISNGIDFERFRRPDKRESVREELGLRSDDKAIGIVANLKRVKNHIFLLKALHEILKKDRRVKLLLVGRGFSNDPENTEPELREFVKDNGLVNHVSFLGYRQDIPDLLSAMDLFCLTSLKEGMPISLLEAMAAGLPVVGTDVEGIREIVTVNRNGFLVHVGDVGGLIKVLRTLIQDEPLRKRIGAESRSLAIMNYSLAQSIKKYDRLFATDLTSL
jgi:L-malate glycosyltransferase